MIISLIVAASTNNAIGVNNQLPWHLPADLKFFKNTTWGMPIIMGRRTFESMNSKPLPGRVNIVVTRREGWKADGVVVVNSINDALFVAEDTDCKEAFIIGGGEIFNTMIKKADTIYMTRVHIHLDGHVFFPAIDEAIWHRTFAHDKVKDEKHAYNFTIEKWEKKD